MTGWMGDPSRGAALGVPDLISERDESRAAIMRKLDYRAGDLAAIEAEGEAKHASLAAHVRAHARTLAIELWALGAPVPVRFSVRRVPLNGGGYDSSGVYWGTGAPLYVAASDDGGAEMHFRAAGREAAKAYVLRYYPSATFYR